jgi:hypothetical protein
LETVSGEFYEEATRGRSASHHLQVKAALALLYHVLGSTNPFAECLAPKFAPEKTELRYHTSSQLGQLLRELREDKTHAFGFRLPANAPEGQKRFPISQFLVSR